VSHASRLPEEDPERKREAATPPAPPRRTDSTASILALQQGIGNHAVARMLARDPDPPPTATATTGSGTASASTKTDEEQFDDAVAADDWAKAAELLQKLPKPAHKALALSAGQMLELGKALSVDQLRLLQDAALRESATLGWSGTFLRVGIRAALKLKGVKDSAAGAQFGTLDWKILERVSAPAKGGQYAYKIEITYLPDTAAVDADEVGFIQTVRLVDTKTGANKDPREEFQNRQTGDSTNIDRLPGKELGWYGMTDTGGGGGTLTTWKKGDPTKPAYMMDRPTWNQPNTTWSFETAVVCKSGPDAGKVYATMTWGFTVDDDNKLTEMDIVALNKPSPGFTAAVDMWNQQAAGPEAKRNAPGQKPLPELK
jgi:hypothetical protein